jgi:hypothetical protein
MMKVSITSLNVMDYLPYFRVKITIIKTVSIMDLSMAQHHGTHSKALFANPPEHYAECHYAECCYAECHYDDCCYVECHFAECCYAECHYAECRGKVNCCKKFHKRTENLLKMLV